MALDVVGLGLAKADAAKRYTPLVVVNPAGVRRAQRKAESAPVRPFRMTVGFNSLAFGVGADGAASGTSDTDGDAFGYVGQLRSLAATRGLTDLGKGAWRIDEPGKVVLSGGGGSSSTGVLGKGRALSATTDTVTVATTPPCTSIQVVIWHNGVQGTKVPRIAVDGGAPVIPTVDINGVAITGDDKFYVVGVGGLADTTHSLVLSGTGAGTSHVSSMVFNRSPASAGGGFQCSRVGIAGFSTVDATGGTSATQRARVARAFAAIPSDLLVLGSPINDQALQGTQGTTPTVMRDNLQLFIDAAASSGQDVLLLGEPESPNAPSGQGVFTEAQYRAEMIGLARANSRVTYLGVPDLVGAYAEANSLGFYTTGSVHPNRFGYGVMAAAVWRLLNSQPVALTVA